MCVNNMCNGKLLLTTSYNQWLSSLSLYIFTSDVTVVEGEGQVMSELTERVAKQLDQNVPAIAILNNAVSYS